MSALISLPTNIKVDDALFTFLRDCDGDEYANEKDETEGWETKERLSES